ncbi:chromatin accessibility complex protein 1 isoform X1 [Gorilla gorilla gorilla]|uniref:chromatin accessibility complex protein 1 isoform X1 n=1 Tax=Gorilla gorilla gorilla TaxID=9595 RepID=UPI002445E84B|nr:chromatin accessibility complex protein 1 isoform X1 [Gorilla gorilla gorilla]
MRRLGARGLTELVVSRTGRSRPRGRASPHYNSHGAAGAAPRTHRLAGQGSHFAVGPAGCGHPREGREDGGRGRGQRQVRGAAAHLAASIPHPGHHEELPRGVQHQPGGVGAHGQGHDILPKKILASKYLKMLKEEKREEDEENDNDNESDHDEADS